MTQERWLLERAVAFLSVLVLERTRRPLVCLPPDGATLLEIERAALIAALDRTGWNQKAAARLVGITPRVMNYKMQARALYQDNPFDRPARRNEPPARRPRLRRQKRRGRRTT